MAIEIVSFPSYKMVDFPIKNGDFPWQNVTVHQRILPGTKRGRPDHISAYDLKTDAGHPPTALNHIELTARGSQHHEKDGS